MHANLLLLGDAVMTYIAHVQRGHPKRASQNCSDKFVLKCVCIPS